MWRQVHGWAAVAVLGVDLLRCWGGSWGSAMRSAGGGGGRRGLEIGGGCHGGGAGCRSSRELQGAHDTMHPCPKGEGRCFQELLLLHFHESDGQQGYHLLRGIRR